MGYYTDLTDKQWQVIENLLNDKNRKRNQFLSLLKFNLLLISILTPPRR